MAGQDEKNPSEIESLNEGILNPDEASLDELEQVSGGNLEDSAPAEDSCGTKTCGTNNCGTF